MKFEYFIFISLVAISAKGANESCLGSCGQYFNSSRPCQCSIVCKTHRNCCNDYDYFCLKGSCVERCDQPYDNRVRCQCNKACKTYKNCCGDYDDFCLLGVTELNTTNYVSSDTTLITSEMIIGIVVSITVVILVIVVILAFMFRRTYSKELCPLSIAGKADRTTNDMDNCIATSGYEQLDIVKNNKSANAYDQLHVTHIVDLDTTNEYSNTMISREENSKYESIDETTEMNYNKVTSEYELLDNANKDKSSNTCVQLHVTHILDHSPTNKQTETIILREKHSKYDYCNFQK